MLLTPQPAALSENPKFNQVAGMGCHKTRALREEGSPWPHLSKGWLSCPIGPVLLSLTGPWLLASLCHLPPAGLADLAAEHARPTCSQAGQSAKLPLRGQYWNLQGPAALPRRHLKSYQSTREARDKGSQTLMVRAVPLQVERQVCLS